MQKLTSGQSTQNKCLWTAQPYMEHLHHTPPLKAKGTLQQDFKEPDIEEDWHTQSLLDTTRPLHSRAHDSYG